MVPHLDSVVRAARQAPFFRRHLAAAGEAPFMSAEDFARRVPCTDKRSLYGPAGPAWSELLRGGRATRVASVLPSSGTSGGAISLGFQGRAEARRGQKALDAALCALFAVDRRRTLLLCTLPNGVSVPSQRCVVVPCGTRHDLFAEFLRKLGPSFQQVLVIGEPWFVRRGLEEAADLGVDLRRSPISVITGGDHLPESLRDHLAELLGLDLDGGADDRVILSSFGMGEVGLNLLLESPELVRIRRRFRDDPALRTRALGCEPATSPALLHFDPRAEHVEAVDGELVFTLLDPRRLQPVVRYRSGDRGGIVDGARLAAALAGAGLEPLIPKSPAPIVWLEGRSQNLPGRPDLPAAWLPERLHELKAHLRAHTSAIATSVTPEGPEVVVQRRPDTADAPAAALEGALRRHLDEAGWRVPVRVVPPMEYGFARWTPYEWKFRAGT